MAFFYKALGTFFLGLSSWHSLMFKIKQIKALLTLILIVFSLAAFAAINSVESTSNNHSTLRFESSQQQTTLIELYTSQGCSSCPPAEQWLNNYVNDPKLWQSVIPIAFHVDYWDYIGWKDIFSLPNNSQRQRKYKQQGNLRAVYTPGFVINGKESKSWFAGRPFSTETKQAGILAAEITHQQLTVSYSEQNSNLDLNVALLGFGFDVPISRGENKNKTLQQDFILLQHKKYRSNNSQWVVNQLPTSHHQAKRYAIALWVSEPNDPTPLQATATWLPAQQ